MERRTRISGQVLRVFLSHRSRHLTYLKHNDAAGELKKAIEWVNVLICHKIGRCQKGFRYTGGAGEGIVETGYESIRIIVVFTVDRPAEWSRGQVLGVHEIQLTSSDRCQTARKRTGSHGDSRNQKPYQL